MYNLNTHSHFSYLKDYLCNFASNNFDDFIKESLMCADVIAANIESGSSYGFSKFIKPYYPNNINSLQQVIKNKVIGDIFELFAGYFMQYFETGTDFGIKRGTYQFSQDMTSSDDTDVGMDGFGIFSATNDNAVIQVKYRSNPNDRPFDKNVFMSLYGAGIIRDIIDQHNINQRLIFITNIPVGSNKSWDGKTKIFNSLKTMSKVPVVLIGYNEIIDKVGSNKTNTNYPIFWKSFYSQFTI